MSRLQEVNLAASEALFRYPKQYALVVFAAWMKLGDRKHKHTRLATSDVGAES